MLSFVELWRALGSGHCQSAPPALTVGTSLVRSVIAFTLAHHHPYFVDRLQLVDNTTYGTKYRCNCCA